jgi:signal transduction histidine kinase
MDPNAPEALSVWSHELRNPVASMVLSAYALRNRVRGSAELAEIVDRLLIAGDRAMVILDAAMEAMSGQESGACEPMPAARCLLDCVRQQTPHADARDVRLDVRLGRSLRDSALVDGRRLRHVIDNVVSNAIRFAANGVVRISATVARDGALIFVIRDDGPGFATLQWEEMPVRPGLADGPLAGGWGIGLRLARQILSAMGGSLALANAPERAPGACVTVRVPLYRRPDIAAPARLLERSTTTLPREARRAEPKRVTAGSRWVAVTGSHARAVAGR